MTPEPIFADCHTAFHASRSSGTRPLEDIKWIVLHDTEGGTAQGVAAYFAQKPNPKTGQPGGSAHLVVDELACYRTLANNEIPWAAPGANTNGFHIEQCGYAKWSAVIWGKHRKTLQRAAYKTAFHCHKFGIPPRFVAAAALKRGVKGVTTHAECTKAFGGDHTDPGPLWPRRLFMRYVNQYYNELAAGQA
jgi:hypothetical protein